MMDWDVSRHADIHRHIAITATAQNIGSRLHMKFAMRSFPSIDDLSGFPAGDKKPMFEKNRHSIVISKMQPL